MIRSDALPIQRADGDRNSSLRFGSADSELVASVVAAAALGKPK